MQTGTTAANRPRAEVETPLSLRWLGIDFRSMLPWCFGAFTIEYGSVDALVPFLARHYVALFGTGGDERWRSESLQGNKLRFTEEADIFLIRTQGETVGYLIGNPSDWSSYYLRSMAILPEHRSLGTYPLFLERLADVLEAAGVDRVEGDICPLNQMHILAATRLGYVQTGTLNTDRWGSLLRVTKFLHPDSERAFHDQYCFGTWPRRRLATHEGPEGRPT